MHPRDIVHVAAHACELGRSREADFRATLCGVPGRFQVQPDVEMPVELGRIITAGCRQHVGRILPAAEHQVDLTHRYPRVRSDRQHPGSGGRRRLGFRHAEEVPRRILNVGWIDEAMGLELAPAIVEATGVIRNRAIKHRARCLRVDGARNHQRQDDDEGAHCPPRRSRHISVSSLRT